MGDSLEINISGSFAGLLFITFLVLKLVGVIDWAWKWVFAPLWSMCCALLVIAVIFSFAAASEKWG